MPELTPTIKEPEHITPTTEEIARAYSAAGDSVQLLAAGKPQGVSAEEWADTVKRNQEHLTIIASKPWWEGSGYDIAGLIAGADMSPPPVTVITMRQAQLALFNAGLIDAVEAAVAAADKKTQIYWKTSTELHRENEVLLDVAKSLKMTPEQVDQLFEEASKL